MNNFAYHSLPSKVLFGSGTVSQVGEQLSLLNINRPIILTTARQRSLGDLVASIIPMDCAGIFNQATMHTPVTVTHEAIQFFRANEADGIISIGGGSTIGLGKAIALQTDADHIAIPTTYAGSEMTAILGQTENGVKTTINSLKVLPESVIYDVDLTKSLPKSVCITSGLNAVAHAAEAMYAEQSNPVLSQLAEDGVRKLCQALPQFQDADADTVAQTDARYDALYGAWLCAICLGNGGVAMHHKLCHVLGGSFDLPHAETHAIVLPQALAFNLPSAPDAMERLKRATQSENPAAAMWDIASNGGVATALKDIGMPEEGIGQAAELALRNPYYNPRPFDEATIRDVINSAWAGTRP